MAHQALTKIQWIFKTVFISVIINVVALYLIWVLLLAPWGDRPGVIIPILFGVFNGLAIAGTLHRAFRTLYSFIAWGPVMGFLLAFLLVACIVVFNRTLGSLDDPFTLDLLIMAAFLGLASAIANSATLGLLRFFFRRSLQE